jgi:hypothetical protein
MARGRKTGGRQKGTLNKRTVARLELRRSHGVVGTALADMRSCAKVMLDLATKEHAKGEHSDGRLIREYTDTAIRALKEVAQYEEPKLSAVRVAGDPANPMPIPLNVSALTDEQLIGLI